MVAVHWILAGASALSSASAYLVKEDWAFTLLKRQAPGTPLYNCHDNCGEAILEAQSSANACKDSIFLTDYANCLQCAGPDNGNIWQFYGPSLSPTAATCGLSTTPLSGVQAAVGPAIPAANASSSTASAPLTTSAAPISSASSALLTSSSGVPSATSSLPVTTSTNAAPATTATTSVASSVVVSNSTTTSQTVVFTGAANVDLPSNVGLLGAILFGGAWLVYN